ncbi:MAG: ATP-dependent zinc metalloprotease FtsH [Christensenellales bacterium]
MKKRNIRTIVIYLLMIAAIVFMASRFGMGVANAVDQLSYEEFLKEVKDGHVAGVVLTGTELSGIYTGSTLTMDNLPGRREFTAYVPSYEILKQDLAAIVAESTGKPATDISALDYGFQLDYREPSEFSFWTLVPYLILIGATAFLWYVMMQQQGGGKSINAFGKSKARMVTSDTNKITFKDVAGADEEKEELAEIVEFLKNPRRFTDMGARVPKGVLLMGPPGTGKTLLAKAVAGEAGAPFYSISGSDFVEMFVGVGASRVRDLFNTAKKSSPAIIFIDEIDAVGRHRGAGLGGGHDEREQTLNQLLVEMDGFDPHAGIIVIAATNRPDILDPALLRPGRFDRQITVGAPDVKGREEILRIHARQKPLGYDVDLKVLAKRTAGFTGADLENMLNEAAILAARKKLRVIGMEEVEEAITRVIAGPEKRSRVISNEDKRITAYHETGHAIVARLLPNCDPVHEISIIQRGRAAGYTMTLPEKETQHMSRAKLKDTIAMLLSGRVAEKLFIGDISTGAYNDLQRATDIARKMVTEYGMSERLGPVFLGGDQEVFIGKDFGHAKNYSEEVASLIDEEIRAIVEEAYAKVEQMLTENAEAVHRVANALIEREKLDGEQFDLLMKGEPLPETPATALEKELNGTDKAELAAPKGAGDTGSDAPNAEKDGNSTEPKA